MIETSQGRDGFAAAVHKRVWNQQPNWFAIYDDFGCRAKEFTFRLEFGAAVFC